MRRWSSGEFGRQNPVGKQSETLSVGKSLRVSGWFQQLLVIIMKHSALEVIACGLNQYQSKPGFRVFFTPTLDEDQFIPVEPWQVMEQPGRWWGRTDALKGQVPFLKLSQIQTTHSIVIPSITSAIIPQPSNHVKPVFLPLGRWQAPWDQWPYRHIWVIHWRKDLEPHLKEFWRPVPSAKRGSPRKFLEGKPCKTMQNDAKPVQLQFNSI